MFVRKKKNRSGTTSAMIAQKKQGKLLELKTIGISKIIMLIYIHFVVL